MRTQEHKFWEKLLGGPVEIQESGDSKAYSLVWEGGIYDVKKKHMVCCWGPLRHIILVPRDAENMNLTRVPESTMDKLSGEGYTIYGSTPPNGSPTATIEITGNKWPWE